MKRKIIVASDASDYGVGVELFHKFEDGSTKPIANALRTLQSNKKREFSNNLCYKEISQVPIRKRIYSANRLQTAVNNIWFEKL